MILIGDNRELILLVRKPRSRFYSLTCIGAKRHYRKDGSCKHTAEVLAKIKPEVVAKVKVEGWGGKPVAPEPK